MSHNEMTKKRPWPLRLLRFLWHFMWTILITLYIFSLLGGLLPSWLGVPFAPFATLFPLFLVGILFVLFDAIRCRRRKFILLSSLLLLLSLGQIWHYCPINLIRWQDPAKEKLHVISYNVATFRFDMRSKSQPSGILNYLNKQSADLVCLQEVTLQGKSKYGLTRKELDAATKKKYPHRIFHLAQGKRGSGMMLLSRYPIKRSEVIPIKSHYNGAIAYYLDVEGKEVLVVNLHLESFKLSMSYSPRPGMGEVKGLVSKMVQAVKRANIWRSYDLRSRQTDDILAYIEEHKPSGGVIVCGDFNATPTDYPQRKMSKRLSNSFAQGGRGLGISFRSGLFVVRIDNIFCSSEFKPEETIIDRRATYSDHFPVSTYLSIK